MNGIDTIKEYITWCKKENKNPSHIQSIDEYVVFLLKKEVSHAEDIN